LLVHGLIVGFVGGGFDEGIDSGEGRLWEAITSIARNLFQTSELGSQQQERTLALGALNTVYNEGQLKC
jgi:hypothetical protein